MFDNAIELYTAHSPQMDSNSGRVQDDDDFVLALSLSMEGFSSPPLREGKVHTDESALHGHSNSNPKKAKDTVDFRQNLNQFESLSFAEMLLKTETGSGRMSKAVAFMFSSLIKIHKRRIDLLEEVPSRRERCEGKGGTNSENFIETKLLSFLKEKFSFLFNSPLLSTPSKSLELERFSIANVLALLLYLRSASITAAVFRIGLHDSLLAILETFSLELLPHISWGKKKANRGGKDIRKRKILPPKEKGRSERVLSETDGSTELEREKGVWNKRKMMDKEESNGLVVPSWMQPVLLCLLLLSRSPLSLFNQAPETNAEDIFLGQKISSWLWNDEDNHFGHKEKTRLMVVSLSLASNPSLSLSPSTVAALLWIIAVLSHDPSLSSLLTSRSTLCQLIHSSFTPPKESAIGSSCNLALRYVFRHALQDRDTLAQMVEKSVRKSFRVRVFRLFFSFPSCFFVCPSTFSSFSSIFSL